MTAGRASATLEGMTHVALGLLIAVVGQQDQAGARLDRWRDPGITPRPSVLVPAAVVVWHEDEICFCAPATDRGERDGIRVVRGVPIPVRVTFTRRAVEAVHTRF